MNLLFFDTETTGKADFTAPPDAPHQPHLVELGALLVSDQGRELARLEMLVRPDGWTIPADATRVHGITTERAAREGLPLEEVFAAFLALARSAVPQPLPTKFGFAEAAEVSFADGQAQYSCLAWRLDADVAELRLSGWTCAGAGQKVDRHAVACLVDRLELAPGTSDRSLRSVFQAAERQRLSGCPPAPIPPRPVAGQRRPA